MFISECYDDNSRSRSYHCYDWPTDCYHTAPVPLSANQKAAGERGTNQERGSTGDDVSTLNTISVMCMFFADGLVCVCVCVCVRVRVCV